MNFTPPGNLIPGLRKKRKNKQEKKEDGFHHFDFDGSWVDPDAYDPERLERDHFGHTKKEANKVYAPPALVRKAEEYFNEICRRSERKPSGYVAVLFLDGDQMSKWLNGTHPRQPRLRDILQDKDILRHFDKEDKRPLYPALLAEVSARMSRFAVSKVPNIVNAHLGRLVYSGGDDVLALLPVTTVLKCAEGLDLELKKSECLGARMTSSAGVAIVHVRSPFRAALRMVRAAESQAKKSGRNAVSIHIALRSGEVHSLTFPWRFNRDGKVAGLKDEDSLDSIEFIRYLTEARDKNDKPIISPALGYRLRKEAEALRGLSWEDPDPRCRQHGGKDEASRLVEGLPPSLPEEAEENAELARDIFLHRMNILLLQPLHDAYSETSSKDSRTDFALMNDLGLYFEHLYDWTPKALCRCGQEAEFTWISPEKRMRRIIEILLLARFLQREEGGQSTTKLLEALKKEEGLITK